MGVSFYARPGWEDYGAILAVAPVSHTFQSSPLMREATLLDNDVAHPLNISIHASREGGDGKNSQKI